MSTLEATTHPNAATKVLLVSHGPTPATRGAAFPADEPLERPGEVPALVVTAIITPRKRFPAGVSAGDSRALRSGRIDAREAFRSFVAAQR